MGAARLVREGAVASVVFSDEGAVTPLSEDLLDDFEDVLDEIEADESVRCVLLSGTGPSFLVGADLKLVRGLSVPEALAYNQRLIDLGERLEAMAPPAIACLNGAAFGGGLELALACSLRLAADGATLGLPEVKLGIVPGAGGLVRLPRMIAPGAAFGMLMSGRTVTAPEALELGIVDEVVPADELLDRASRLAAQICRAGPLAIRLVKRMARETAAMPTPEAVAAVQDRLGELLESGDAREGIAAFLEKRAPGFTGS